MADRFYDDLAAHYHLLFADWDASMQRQAARLDSIIREEWSGTRSVLDAAAGIGTQAIGLGLLGYDVTASDASNSALERARIEADARGLTMPTIVSDLRQISAGDSAFDLVIACDNSLPHLLCDEDVLQALRECCRCARPGGGCLFSMRDYEGPRTGSEMHPHGVRPTKDGRVVLFQVWDWDGPCYDLSLFIVRETSAGAITTDVFRTRYYAITTSRVLELMSEAGLANVRRIDDRFYQPILVGTKPR